MTPLDVRWAASGWVPFNSTLSDHRLLTSLDGPAPGEPVLASGAKSTSNRSPVPACVRGQVTVPGYQVHMCMQRQRMRQMACDTQRCNDIE